MVPSLRKTHRRIWIALAILLPVLYIASILIIPEEAKQEILYQDAEAPKIQPEQPGNVPQNDIQ